MKFCIQEKKLIGNSKDFITTLRTNKGDKYLLCSDGIADNLSNEELGSLMYTYRNSRECLANMINAIYGIETQRMQTRTNNPPQYLRNNNNFKDYLKGTGDNMSGIIITNDKGVKDNMEYSEACSEVWYILEGLDIDELTKIPKRLLDIIYELKIDNYKSKIDLSKPFEEQELSQATIGLISYIYNNYLGTREEKERYLNSLNDYNDYKIEFDNLKIDKGVADEKMQLAEYKESFWDKIKKFIDKILHKN